MPVSAEHVFEALQASGKKLATAESCTGGGLSAMLTDIPGSSIIFERGFVTYSNESKQELLDVPARILQEFGAVSRETAAAMAVGALRHSRADIAVSITGIAGPGGGTDLKPVGLVYISCVEKAHPVQNVEYRFNGTRPEIRRQSIEAALQAVLDMLALSGSVTV